MRRCRDRSAAVHRIAAPAGAILLAALLAAVAGCSGPMLVVGAVSLGATGKGLDEHALDLVTGEDCRLLEGLVREDRDFCEPPGSPATENDFKGFVHTLHERERKGAEKETAAVPEPAPAVVRFIPATTAPTAVHFADILPGAAARPAEGACRTGDAMRVMMTAHGVACVPVEQPR